MPFLVGPPFVIQTHFAGPQRLTLGLIRSMLGLQDRKVGNAVALPHVGANLMSKQDDPTGWMWIHACEVIVKAERLQRQFFQPSASQRTLAVWEPPIDVFEDEAEIVIVVAMPGVISERVQVTHEPGTLVVRGLRPLSLSGARRRVRQLEIPYGAFERRIPLPHGRLEIGPPKMAQGCLTLRLRKVYEAQP